ncbi:MAG: hypothetical protein AAFP03_05955 [Cyanobacteria bacterium J06598_3]
MIATPKNITVDYNQPRINWSDADYAAIGKETKLFDHDYHALPLFETEALIELLDGYPRAYLQAFTMGDDKAQRSEWQCVDIHPDSTGADIWRAVEKGRLWLNIISIEKQNPDYGRLVKGMYQHLNERCPQLGDNLSADYTTLLISSPGAQVYYHMDESPNMLWHISGQKKLWVYPAMDLRFVPQDFLEEIYTGEIAEFLPYRHDFDQHAQEFLLTPGKVVSWPHNAPHRIENLSMNVSLTTSFRAPLQRRRELVQKANRYILRNLGVKARSMEEEGLRASIKRTSFRVANKIKPFKPTKHPHDDYVTTLQIDPSEPNGLRTLDKPVVASFSKNRKN